MDMVHFASLAILHLEFDYLKPPALVIFQVTQNAPSRVSSSLLLELTGYGNLRVG